MTKQKESFEATKEPKKFNPDALLLLSQAGTTDESLRFELTTIGREQCVVAQVVDLAPELKEAFDGSRKIVAFDGSTSPGKGDRDAQLSWDEWSNSLSACSGEAGIQIQTAMSGTTGRQKELQIGLFDLHNGSDLITALQELNVRLRLAGVEPQEGVPEKYDCLPVNLLISSAEFRAESNDEFTGVRDAQLEAVGRGVLAHSGK